MRWLRSCAGGLALAFEKRDQWSRFASLPVAPPAPSFCRLDAEGVVRRFPGFAARERFLTPAFRAASSIGRATDS